ncbi:MAG: hypothetical protein V5A16_04510 [Haloplanus sp.]
MRPTNRRRCGVLGGGLVCLAVVTAATVDPALLAALPTATRVSLLAAAGALDLVAAFETPLTQRIDWFRLGGLANVVLGSALPVGLLEGGGGAGGTLLFAVTAVGGLSLAAIGADLFLYAGAHVYERPIDADDGGGTGAVVE